MRRFWCYAPHRIAVQEWLCGKLHMPQQFLQAVEPRTMHILQGLEDEVFIRIANHPAVVPQPLWEMLSERGFTLITIDDSNNRRRHEERHGRPLHRHQ